VAGKGQGRGDGKVRAPAGPAGLRGTSQRSAGFKAQGSADLTGEVAGVNIRRQLKTVRISCL